MQKYPLHKLQLSFKLIVVVLPMQWGRQNQKITEVLFRVLWKVCCLKTLIDLLDLIKQNKKEFEDELKKLDERYDLILSVYTH